MFRLSATLRIALGLACLGLSVFLASRTLGLGQDECLTRAQGRAALCETVALHVSTQLEHGSQDELTENLEQLVNNNRDIESIRIRLGDHVVIRAGDHEAYLKKKDSESESQACVPVFQGTKVIGNIEMCFADTYPSGVFEILASPEILQLVFVSCRVHVVLLPLSEQDARPSGSVKSNSRSSSCCIGYVCRRLVRIGQQ